MSILIKCTTSGFLQVIASIVVTNIIGIYLLVGYRWFSSFLTPHKYVTLRYIVTLIHLTLMCFGVPTQNDYCITYFLRSVFTPEILRLKLATAVSTPTVNGNPHHSLIFLQVVPEDPRTCFHTSEPLLSRSISEFYTQEKTHIQLEVF